MLKTTVCLLALALLAGCGGGQKHFPLQPIAPSDEGAYHIRSVTVLAPDVNPDFESGFRNALNAGANTEMPEGDPVDLVLTVERFRDASIAEEMIGGGSYARAEIRLNNPARRNRPVFRDLRSAGRDPTNVSADVQTSQSSGMISLLASLAASAIIGAATNEAEAMGATLAGFVVEDLLEPGKVQLAENAAFALPPQGRDPAMGPQDRDQPFRVDDTLAAPMGEDALTPLDDFGTDAFALADTPSSTGTVARDDQTDPMVAASADALFLGTYDDRAAAEAERADILAMDGDLVSADDLSIAETDGRFVVSAVLADAAAIRALCARRSVEDRPCHAP